MVAVQIKASPAKSRSESPPSLVTKRILFSCEDRTSLQQFNFVLIINGLAG